jgi:3-hydroxyacyl-[acyl-carrier-protein] dehydratase
MIPVAASNPSVLDIRAIMDILPHRYPFLLIDRVLEVEPGQRAVALKNVTANEPQFTGHFPGRPLMPGVLIVEAMAQVAGIIMLQIEAFRGKIALFAGIDGVRFRRPVQPGDQLRLTAEVLKIRGTIGRVSVTAHVGDELVTEGELLFALVD